MTMSLVRLVGGENSGKEVWHDTDAHGPTLRMTLHPDFNVCPSCMIDEPVQHSELVMHQEEYLIHKLNFETGHFHYYAAPPRWRLVDLLNALWDGYTTDADKEKRDGH